MRLFILSVLCFLSFQIHGQEITPLEQFIELKSNLESNQVEENRPVVVIDQIRSSNEESALLAEYLTSALEITLSELDYFQVEDPSSRPPSTPNDLDEIQTFTIGVSGFVSKVEDAFKFTYEIQDVKNMDVIAMEEAILFEKDGKVLRQLKTIPNYDQVKSFSGSVFGTCLKISKSLISTSKVIKDLGGQPTQDVFQVK